jgi:hypothetical protein
MNQIDMLIMVEDAKFIHNMTTTLSLRNCHVSHGSQIHETYAYLPFDEETCEFTKKKDCDLFIVTKVKRAWSDKDSKFHARYFAREKLETVVGLLCDQTSFEPKALEVRKKIMKSLESRGLICTMDRDALDRLKKDANRSRMVMFAVNEFKTRINKIKKGGRK